MQHEKSQNKISNKEDIIKESIKKNVDSILVNLYDLESNIQKEKQKKKEKEKIKEN